MIIPLGPGEVTERRTEGSRLGGSHVARGPTWGSEEGWGGGWVTGSQGPWEWKWPVETPEGPESRRAPLVRVEPRPPHVTRPAGRGWVLRPGLCRSRGPRHVVAPGVGVGTGTSPPRGEARSRVHSGPHPSRSTRPLLRAVVLSTSQSHGFLSQV